MASSSLLHIEVAPSSPGPAPSSERCRRQRALTDPSAFDLQDGHASQRQTPLEHGPQGAGSSGYMSSCSNIQSPRVLVEPHPLWSEGENEREEVWSRGNRHHHHHHQLSALRDSLYSRLDHTPNSTLTRPTHRHQPAVTSRPHPLQKTLSSQQPQSHRTPLHSDQSRGTPFCSNNQTDGHSTDQFHEATHRSNVGMKRRRSPPMMAPPATSAPRTPLTLIMKTLEGLDGEVKRWIIKADQHLKWEEFDNAIPYLESTIVRTHAYPHLQLLLWELLGNAQMATGMSKKASVCYLHHLAYCRSQQDFRGLTRAECNLGIAYMQLGLFKLAGRCFLQYLRNCRKLQDECGIESACSNLGLLSKALALKHYKAAMATGERGLAMSSLAMCLRRAVIFFKQHLEIVLAHGDM